MKISEDVESGGFNLIEYMSTLLEKDSDEVQRIIDALDMTEYLSLIIAAKDNDHATIDNIISIANKSLLPSNQVIENKRAVVNNLTEKKKDISKPDPKITDTSKPKKKKKVPQSKKKEDPNKYELLSTIQLRMNRFENLFYSEKNPNRARQIMNDLKSQKRKYKKTLKSDLNLYTYEQLQNLLGNLQEWIAVSEKLPKKNPVQEQYFLEDKEWIESLIGMVFKYMRTKIKSESKMFNIIKTKLMEDIRFWAPTKIMQLHANSRGFDFPGQQEYERTIREMGNNVADYILKEDMFDLKIQLTPYGKEIRAVLNEKIDIIQANDQRVKAQNRNPSPRTFGLAQADNTNKPGEEVKIEPTDRKTIAKGKIIITKRDGTNELVDDDDVTVSDGEAPRKLPGEFGEAVNRMTKLSGIKNKTTVMEKSPPGFSEKTMKKLKKQYPNDLDRVYATAWTIHNNKKNKK